MSFKGTVFFIFEITAAFFVGHCRKYLYVVLLNNTGHVFHGAITELEGVFIDFHMWCFGKCFLTTLPMLVLTFWVNEELNHITLRNLFLLVLY